MEVSILVREGTNVPFPRIKFFKNANFLNANDLDNFNIENKTKAMSRTAGYQRVTLNIRLKRRKGRGTATMTSRTASNAEVPGWYIELQANVLRQLPRPGEIDATTAMGWNQNQKTLKKVLARVLLPKIQKTYEVSVDYTKTLAEMISVGKYDWQRDEISEKFKLEESGKQEVVLVLVHLNRIAETDTALESIELLLLEPAKIEHLLAVGATHPEIQREFPVVALGSSFSIGGTSCGFPYLDFRGGRRIISVLSNHEPFGCDLRFLAVRKAV